MVKAAHHRPSACPAGSRAVVPALRFCQFRSGNSLREPPGGGSAGRPCWGLCPAALTGPQRDLPQGAASRDPSTEMKPYPLPETRAQRQRYHPSPGYRPKCHLASRQDKGHGLGFGHVSPRGLGHPRWGRLGGQLGPCSPGRRPRTSPGLSGAPLCRESPASLHGVRAEAQAQWDLNRACARGCWRATPEFSLVTSIFQELTLKCFFFYNTVGES